jgi:hypothetical protein
MITIFTSANLTYLPQCLILRESVERHEPDAHFVLVLVDKMPSNPIIRERLELFDEVMLVEDLLGDECEDWMAQYDVVEACTSVKGRAVLRLLERGDNVIYLDPDTALFGPLDAFTAQLETSSVVLTPHQLEPAITDTPWIADEISSLAYGIYNFGMFGVRACPEGIAFAEWWDERLSTLCIDDIPRGLFVDQRWGDFVPNFFPDATICRHPGINLASWNLHQRLMTLDANGDYQVNGYPLVMYHFTKGTGIGLQASRAKMDDNPLAADLWRWYLERLELLGRGYEAPLWAFAPMNRPRTVASAGNELMFQEHSDATDVFSAFTPDDQLSALPVGSISSDRSTIVGKGGVLFIYQGSNGYHDQYINRRSDSLGIAWAELTEERHRWIGESAQVLSLFIPNKATCLPDLYPLPLDACPTPAWRDLRVALGARDDVLFCDSLLEASLPANRRERNPWGYVDSHLSEFGCLETVNDVLRQMGYDEFTLDAMKVKPLQGFGDLSSKFGAAAVGNFVTRRLATPTARPTCIYLSESDVEIENSTGRCVTWQNPEAPVQLTLCIVGNSFAGVGNSTDHLTYWFAHVFTEVTFLHSGSIPVDVVEAYSADVVLFQGVERFLVQVPVDVYTAAQVKAVYKSHEGTRA